MIPQEAKELLTILCGIAGFLASVSLVAYIVGSRRAHQEWMNNLDDEDE